MPPLVIGPFPIEKRGWKAAMLTIAPVGSGEFVSWRTKIRKRHMSFSLKPDITMFPYLCTTTNKIYDVEAD